MTSHIEGSRESAPRGALFAFLAVAGLLGAAGVALAAVAAHRVESPALATAATMLMIHAAGGIAIAAFVAAVGRFRALLGAAALMLFAATLFSGDIALQTFAGRHIFPMAAPVGGSLLIASWLLVALLAAWAARGAR